MGHSEDVVKRPQHAIFCFVCDILHYSVCLVFDKVCECVAILPACAAEGDMMTEAGAIRRTGPLLAPVLTTRAPV